MQLEMIAFELSLTNNTIWIAVDEAEVKACLE